MAYRSVMNRLPQGKECVLRVWISHFQKASSVLHQTGGFHQHIIKHCGRTRRTFHTGTPWMVAKLLSIDDLFAKRSLQGYLKKMETEYSECLRVVNGTGAEEQFSEDELRAKRTKVSLLAPLVHSIRELETKQKEVVETEALLKGKVTASAIQRD